MASVDCMKYLQFVESPQFRLVTVFLFVDHLADGCVVYTGLDDITGKQLCIIEWKIQFDQMKCPNLNRNDAIALIANMKAKIESRMETMKKLKHDNLINYDTFTWSPNENGMSIYLIRDYYEQSVKKITHSVGWTNENAQKVILGLLNAVKYLHGNDYAHGNINESTIFVGNSGQCKVADFGVIPYLNGIKDNVNNIINFNEPSATMDFQAIGNVIHSFGLTSGKIRDFIINCKSSFLNTDIDWLMNHPFLTETAASSFFHENYQIIKTLGSGAFGVVLKVKNYHEQEHFALKLVKLEKDNDKNECSTSEIKVLAKLKHDNIVGYKTGWMDKMDITEYKKYKNEIDNNANESMESDAESAIGTGSNASVNMDFLELNLSENSGNNLKQA